MAQLSSSKAKAVALAMTGIAAATSFPASAQQATAINATISAPATAQRLTEDQCKVFMGFTAQYIKLNGRENLSDAFVNAMVDFAVNRKCAGPANIPTAGREIDVFNSIRRIMYSTTGVELQKIGVVQVRRTASLERAPN